MDQKKGYLTSTSSLFKLTSIPIHQLGTASSTFLERNSTYCKRVRVSIFTCLLITLKISDFPVQQPY